MPARNAFQNERAIRGFLFAENFFTLWTEIYHEFFHTQEFDK